jgi:NTP pyrophosphatase (non-canonical NTP hydrolase)
MYLNTRIPVYTDALKCWGEDFQKSMFHEEIGEVLTAMSHEKRGRCGKEAVLEELADLQIMLNQMVVLYGTDAEFQRIFDVKIHRLIGRIERYRL